MSIKSVSIVAAATMALFAGAAHAQVNGFANGGFEMVGESTPAASWLAAASGYSLSTDARTGQYAAELSSVAFNAAVMLQNSVEQGGLAPLVAGDNPLLSFWSKGTAGGTGNVLFALRYLDGTGNILANSRNQFFQGRINESTWTEITYDLGAVPVGAVAAFIEFSQAIGPIEPGLPAGRVLIDDLFLSVVPEPGTYALMLAGLVAVGAVARRRRAA
jgi:PEP-CTERM motif